MWRFEATEGPGRKDCTRAGEVRLLVGTAKRQPQDFQERRGEEDDRAVPLGEGFASEGAEKYNGRC